MGKSRLTGSVAAVAASLSLAIGSALAPESGRADTVSYNVLSKPDVLWMGNQPPDLYGFDVTGRGTLSVSLDDNKWPEPFQSLTVEIVSPQSVLATLNPGDGQTVAVSQAGLFYALVTGIVGTTTGFNLGMFTLNINFTPSATPVPLPSAISLILTGLGLLGVGRFLGSALPSAGWWNRQPQPG